MATLNKVQIIGRLGGDPEGQTLNTGSTVTRMSVATTESWKDKDGHKQEKTEWHRVVAWNQLGVICDRHLNKGSQVYVEGRLQTRSWEDQQGKKQYTTEIVASNVQFLGDKSPQENSGPSFNSTDEIPF